MTLIETTSSGSAPAPCQSYETPTFDSRSAFAWTLRAGEIARREKLSRPAAPAAAPRCETPTFDPRCAFAWTLRAGKLARRRSAGL